MIELFPDQEELMAQLRDTMSRNRNVLLQAATGSGKTVLSASIIHRARNKNTRSMMVVPRRELLRQTAKTFDKYEIPFSYCAAGQSQNNFAKTFLATGGSLLNRIRAGRAPDVNLLIIDETHVGGDGLDEIITYYKSRGAWLLGLSATPARLDGQGLDRWYDAIVCGPSIAWLIENKRLSPYRMFAPSRPDLSKVRVVAGDYARGDLSSLMEESSYLIGDAVRHYKDHANGLLNIAYCTSRRHSGIVADGFRSAGIPAAEIDGTTPDAERVQIIKAFARREIKVLTSCDLLLYGFDLAAQSGMEVTVEAMSDLRPTKSIALQLQKYGRVLRMKDQPAMIFDHAGNAVTPEGKLNHGFPDDDRHWTLRGDYKNSQKSGGTFPVSQCEECYFVHRPASSCPNCGHVRVVEGRMIQQQDGELQEITRSALPAQPPTPEELEKRKKAINAMSRSAISRGVPPGRAIEWARQKYENRETS